MAIVQSEGALQGGPSINVAYAPRSQGITWYDGRNDDYAAIYRTQPNVRTVVDFFARNIAQIGLNLFSRVGENQRESLGDHPLAKLIRTPNRALKVTRHRFIKALVSDLKIFDNAFALKLADPRTGELSLFRLPAQYMYPSDDSPWYYATSWRFTGVSPSPVFSSEDLLHVRGYNPDDQRVGLSPIETLRRILAEDNAAGEYREQFWQGGARISGVIERPASGQGTPRWSDTAKQRFVEEWKAATTGGGRDAGGTPLLEDGMTFKQVAFSAKDSEYIAARQLGRAEVASVYHLSPIFVGILDNANFNNVSEQHKNLYQDAFGPDLDMIEEDFELQLFPEFPDLEELKAYLEFNLADKLKGSFEEEAKVLQAAVGAPYLTRNEARARQNQPPVDGGDELVTPLNVLIGGQASPQDSAPPVTASRKALPLVKSAADLSPSAADWVVKHVDVLNAFFERQGLSMKNALGNGSIDVETAWNESRWNTELHDDLMSLSTDMTTEVASSIAESFGGTYDPDLANDFIDANVTAAASNINETTKAELAGLDRSDADFSDNVVHVFEVAAAARALQIAVTRSNAMTNFANREGGEQAGATKKRWKVRSANSRHPLMNGETVGIGETFSNGARWPGDQQDLPTGQTAGCTCELEIIQ